MSHRIEAAESASAVMIADRAKTPGRSVVRQMVEVSLSAVVHSGLGMIIYLPLVEFSAVQTTFFRPNRGSQLLQPSRQREQGVAVDIVLLAACLTDISRHQTIHGITMTAESAKAQHQSG